MTTGINFNQIPSTVNVPLFYLEINSTATVNPRTQLGTLLFGISTGDADIEGEVISVGSAAQANELYGQGSQLATMVEAYRANDRYGPLNCIGLKEGASFRAASKLVKFEGTPIENGSIVLYVGGRRISVPVVRGKKLYTGIKNDPGALDSIVEYVNSQDNYPFTAVGGGDDGDQELYIPLPIHPDEFSATNATSKFDTDSIDASYEHKEPVEFIQPGAKYKKDPRNTNTSSVYYVPSTNSEYSNIITSEYTAGKLVLINKNDTDGVVVNRNNTSGSEWASCHYDSTFGLDISFEFAAAGTPGDHTQIQLTLKAGSYSALRSLLGIYDGETVATLRLTVGGATYYLDESNELDVDTTFPAAGIGFDGNVTGTYAVSTSYDVSIQARDGSGAVGSSISLGSFTTNATINNNPTITNLVSHKIDTISAINYPGDVNDSDEFYVPLPIHTDTFATSDVDNDFSFNTTSGTDDYEHKAPTDFIQPGAKYKLDARNSSTSSIYYVPSTNSDYSSLTSNEYTAPSIVAVNIHDGDDDGPDNPNYTGGANEWDSLQYTAVFDHDGTISGDATTPNYPGDPPETLGSGKNDNTGDKYFQKSLVNRRGLVRWLLAYNYVLFTSKWQGADSNDYDVRGSINPTESFPKGLSVIGLNQNFTGGVGRVSDLLADWDSLLKSLSDSEYLLMVHPESGRLLSNLGLGDSDSFFDALTDRWDYISQLYGHGLGAIVGNYTETDVVLNNFFDTAAFSSFYFGNTPTPAWECVSALAGSMIDQVRGNPKLPYNNIEIKGVIPPSLKDRPSYLLRERLLRAGISTTKSSGSKVYIERPVTGDPKWRDLSRRLSAAFIAVDVRDYVISQVGRSVIADEGTIALPGSGVVTPPTIKSVISTRINSLVSRGYIENFNDSDVSVLRDIDDPTRVNIGIAVDPTNPLYVLASRLDVGN